jgi:exonuclease III
MAKVFSLASWNVEHFRGKKAERVKRVVGFLKAQRPDVLAIYEVEGGDVFASLVKEMPGYQFQLTEGRNTQEILVGVKSGFTSFMTQKLDFKRGNPSLRPGAILTLRVDGKNYTLLFLHTKSGPTPEGFGLRDEMIRRAFNLKKKLDKHAGGPNRANYIFLGDLNTMGMKYPYKKKIDAETEIRNIERAAKRRKMKLLTKNHPHTWWNGPGGAYPPSNLDHVVASERLRFKKFGGADVSVRGWPEEPTPARQGRWIERYSDHALLYLEVQKV